MRSRRRPNRPSVSCRLLPTPHLLIEPGVFQAPAVEDAVDHRRDVLDSRVAAGAEVVAVDDRSGGILGQAAVDLPDQLLALLLVGLDRLLLVHLFELGIAIIRVVAL